MTCVASCNPPNSNNNNIIMLTTKSKTVTKFERAVRLINFLNLYCVHVFEKLAIQYGLIWQYFPAQAYICGPYCMLVLNIDDLKTILGLIHDMIKGVPTWLLTKQENVDFDTE